MALAGRPGPKANPDGTVDSRHCHRGRFCSIDPDRDGLSGRHLDRRRAAHLGAPQPDGLNSTDAAESTAEIASLIRVAGMPKRVPTVDCMPWCEDGRPPSPTSPPPGSGRRKLNHDSLRLRLALREPVAGHTARRTGRWNPHEIFQSDQWCRSEETVIFPLAGDRRDETDGFALSACRTPDNREEACLRHLRLDVETFLTPAEARDLAAALVEPADAAAHSG